MFFLQLLGKECMEEPTTGEYRRECLRVPRFPNLLLPGFRGWGRRVFLCFRWDADALKEPKAGHGLK